MIDVATWQVSQINQAQQSATLKVSPEYQRRPVWTKKDQMLLIDSIARGVPVGAITLYVDSEPGYEVYEVIDGKQRITALMAYLNKEIEIKTSQIASAVLDDDVFGDDDVITRDFHEKPFDELATPERMRFLQYKVPVFLVKGDRASAIRAFARMNRNPYTLKPQEIRNAFYSETTFLRTAIETVQTWTRRLLARPALLNFRHLCNWER